MGSQNPRICHLRNDTQAISLSLSGLHFKLGIPSGQIVGKLGAQKLLNVPLKALVAVAGLVYYVAKGSGEDSAPSAPAAPAQPNSTSASEPACSGKKCCRGKKAASQAVLPGPSAEDEEEQEPSAFAAKLKALAQDPVALTVAGASVVTAATCVLCCTGAGERG